MKIQEFTLQKFIEQIQQKPELAKKYYSSVYQREFPLKRDLVAKLEPIAKEDVKLWLPDFEKRNFPNSRFGNFRDHPLHFAQDEYFLFGYRMSQTSPLEKSIEIRFRTLGEDKLVDDFLEYLQEVFIVRYGCQHIQEGVIINERLKKVLEVCLKENEHLIENPCQAYVCVPKGNRKSYIKEEISCMIEVLDYMDKKEYNIPQIIKKIELVEISSHWKKDSIIWNSFLRNLSLAYQE